MLYIFPEGFILYGVNFLPPHLNNHKRKEKHPHQPGLFPNTHSELCFGGGGCGEHPSGNNVKLFTGFYSMQTCGYEGYTDAGEDASYPAPIVVFCGLML